jgi:hypothetical protein
MASSIKLPSTPNVIVRGNQIIVVFENGNEVLWDNEESQETALRIAKELEVELRAVKYVQKQVHDFIIEMRKYLSSLEINDGLLDTILIDGHAFARSQLNKSTFNTIITGAERGLRKEILENLSHDFIV